MATYSRRERTTVRVEFPVPAERPYGASWAEVMKAIHAAHVELWDAGVVEQDRDASDGTIWLLPGDDEVVVYYEREVRP